MKSKLPIFMLDNENSSMRERVTIFLKVNRSKWPRLRKTGRSLSVLGI